MIAHVVILVTMRGHQLKRVFAPGDIAKLRAAGAHAL